MSAPVVATMATYPPRYDMALRTMQHYHKQVDRFLVYVNNDPGCPPPWINRTPSNCQIILGENAHGCIGDVGKFYPLRYIEDEAYVLTLDDDLNYPENYAKRMTEKVDEYDRECVIGVHGCDIDPKADSYYNGGQIHKTHYTKPQPKDRAVHLLGTGTVAFWRDLLDITLKDFTVQNMADIFLAKYCQREGIGMVMIARQAGWIRKYPTPDDGIYDRFHDNDAIQTWLIKQMEWNHHVHTTG